MQHLPCAARLPITRACWTAETGELCSGCHSDIPGDTTKMVSEHKPVADGNCAGCHNPHAGKIAKLLLDKQPRLCLNCHTQIADLMNKGTAHPPAKEDCSRLPPTAFQ